MTCVLSIATAITAKLLCAKTFQPLLNIALHSIGIQLPAMILMLGTCRAQPTEI